MAHIISGDIEVEPAATFKPAILTRRGSHRVPKEEGTSKPEVKNTGEICRRHSEIPCSNLKGPPRRDFLLRYGKMLRLSTGVL